MLESAFQEGRLSPLSAALSCAGSATIYQNTNLDFFLELILSRFLDGEEYKDAPIIHPLEFTDKNVL